MGVRYFPSMTTFLIYEYIRDRGATVVGDIRRALGVDNNSLARRLRFLVNAGLIRRLGRGVVEAVDDGKHSTLPWYGARVKYIIKVALQDKMKNAKGDIVTFKFKDFKRYFWRYGIRCYPSEMRRILQILEGCLTTIAVNGAKFTLYRVERRSYGYLIYYKRES